MAIECLWGGGDSRLGGADGYRVSVWGGGDSRLGG